MLPYQVAMDYGSFQRQSPVGVGVGVGGPHQGAAGALNINPAFTHSWFVPADLCVPYKQSQGPLLEPGHVARERDSTSGVSRVPRELCHSEWIMGMVMGSGRAADSGGGGSGGETTLVVPVTVTAVDIRREGGKPMVQMSVRVKPLVEGVAVVVGALPGSRSRKLRHENVRIRDVHVRPLEDLCFLSTTSST
uniref:Uncharacterized protein n=1 Tax=Vespula pensylvanica TaxID=30213 RepID=A0A834UCV4_VESPE|nr:hypothetical protein H0235_004415 [Vespula pensylvanica]